MSLPILQLDIAGNPADWITHRQAISMVANDKVIANLGSEDIIFLGGHNRVSGLRSKVSVGSILLTKERVFSERLSKNFEPPYSKRVLFGRDDFTCLFCGEAFPPYYLTRDHIIPKSRGGSDAWANSATCCKRCNHEKGDRTPEQWGQLLLAVPFTPNWAEYLYILNKNRMIEEQHAFLQQRFPKGSVLRSDFQRAA